MEDDVGGFIRTVQLDVFGANKEDVSQNMERLYRVLGVDAETGKFGKLHVNGTYLPCRIKASKKVTWKSFTVIETELSFTAEKLSWVMVESRSFYPQTEASALEGLDFPFDFSFDFTERERKACSMGRLNSYRSTKRLSDDSVWSVCESTYLN